MDRLPNGRRVTGFSRELFTVRGMFREIDHLLIAHVSHLNRRTGVAHIAPVTVVAAQPFAVTTLVANEDIRFDMRPDH